MDGNDRVVFKVSRLLLHNPYLESLTECQGEVTGMFESSARVFVPDDVLTFHTFRVSEPRTKIKRAIFNLK